MSPGPESSSDIHSWLASLGLEQYAAAFTAQSVDFDVLTELSDSDLAQLGIPLGHRRKLLRAIASIRTAGEDAAIDPATASVPERRYITVMFCDLVGSTALSRQLDPEDLRPIIRAYQDCCAGIVARLDGFICRYIGDGILIYFGYPRAHEDDAERAVRASLDIVQSVSRLAVSGDMKLQVRIGITTGLVVVGELIGSGVSQEVAAIGDAPNIAARLQSMALPDSIVVDDTTRTLTQGLFKFDNLGPQQLKGLNDHVQAWLVLSERDRGSRFEATRGAQLVPLVNRNHEIGFLQDAWRQVGAGKGQIVLINGEPGIGKSRLLAAFTEKLGHGGHAELRFQGSPHHQSSALYPFLEQLRRAAQLRPEDQPREKLDKIAAHFAGTVTSIDEAVRVFGALLVDPIQRARSCRALAQRRQAAGFRHSLGADGDALLIAAFAGGGGGCALARPDIPRVAGDGRRQYSDAPAAAARHLSAGSAACPGQPPQRKGPDGQSPGPPRVPGHRAASRQQQVHPRTAVERDHRAHRRCGAVRRGADQGRARIRDRRGPGRPLRNHARRQDAGDSDDTQRLADGAARPQCRHARAGADRLRYRPRVLLRHARSGFPMVAGNIERSARQARQLRIVALRRRTAAGRLSLQACSGPGCGL